MLGTLFRLAWRMLVGVVAILLASITAFSFYPYLDDHFPLAISLIILYLLTAYLIIPFLVRLWHLVLRPNHLPHYAVSRDGWSSDPVNIAIVCRDEQQLRRAMGKSGWFVADKGTLRNTLREGCAILFNRPYPTAPFSKLFLFGRPQDIGFQIQTGTPPTPRHRHHIRFWQLSADQSSHHHAGFWQRVLAVFPGKKRQIWIGTATHDVRPFALRIQNLQITHKIDAETSKERDYVIRTLSDSRVVRRRVIIPAGEPIRFRGQSFGTNIVTDGTLHVVKLK